jgi:hypothetical protein
MYQDKIVLCGSNSYDKKFYFNDDFDSLPQRVKDELKVMCVLYTEEISGIITLYFEEDGTLEIATDHEENDVLFDEIGSVLKIKQLRSKNRDLLESLEMYFKVFYLGEDADDPDEA